MILRFLDDDEATVLFDCVDATGATNPGGVQAELLGGGFDLGGVGQEMAIFEPSSGSGGRVSHRREGLVSMSWRQQLRAASLDGLNEGLNTLLALMRDPRGPIEWRPDGAAESRFIDYVGAPVLPQVLRGQERGLFLYVTTRDDPDGLPVEVLRQPYLRGPELLPYVNDALNPTLLLAGGPPGSVAGRPTAWDGFLNYPILERIDPVEQAYEFSVIASGASTGLQLAGASYRRTVVPGEYLIWSAEARLLRAMDFAFAQLLLTTVDSGGANTGDAYGTQNYTTAWQRLLSLMRAPANTAYAYPRFYSADSGSPDPGSLRTKVRRVQFEIWHTARDTFNRVNTAAGAGLGRLQSGQLWVPYTGTMAISGNEAVASTLGAVGWAASLAEMPTADGEVVLRSHTNSYFAFRGIDGDNLLLLRFDVPGAGITLDYRVNGVNTWTGAFGSIPGLAAGYQAIRVRMEGANIKVYVNETLEIDWTMPAAVAALFTAGRLVGPLLTNLTDSKLDSFNFAPLAAPTGPTPFRTGVTRLRTQEPVASPGLTLPLYIEGDAPTPLRLRVTRQGTQVEQEWIYAYGSRFARLPEWLGTGKILQAESPWAAPNTNGVVDSTASPGSGTSARESIAGTGVQIEHRTTTLLEWMVGRRWRVLWRVEEVAAASTWKLTLNWALNWAGAAPRTNPIAIASGEGSYHFVDVGAIEVDKVPAALWTRLDAERLSGAGQIRFDYCVFVPEEKVARLEAEVDPGIGSFIELDAEEGSARRHDIAGAYMEDLVVRGPMLFAEPGPGGLVVLLDGSQLAQEDDVAVSYSPRYFA